MKTLLSFIIVAMATFTSSCGQTENNTSSNEQAEKMLLEFYTNHFEVWSMPSLPSDVRYVKLDSLMQKFCTSKLRNEAKEAFENVGVDFLTNDRIGASNENLKVEKEAGNENGYIVSFISDVALYSDALGEQIKKQVVLYVTVVKEGEEYKIASVK
jgi:hypothetical protein